MSLSGASRTPLRVLMVEDSPDDVQLVVRELRRGGYEPSYERVETAEDLRRALEVGVWDLIISDYDMPHFRAPEALRLFQERGLDIPFLVVSGSVGEEIAVRMMRAGASDYVIKDRLARLSSAVTRELREAESRRRYSEAEEALRRSERRFRSLVEQAADAIFVLDPEGKVVDANRHACESLGYTREELLAMSVQEIATSLDHGTLAEAWDEVKSGAPLTLEAVHRRADGTTFPVEVRIGVFDEERLLMIAVARDLTERREAERALAAAEARYRTLVEQIPAVTYVQEPVESENPKAVTYISPQYETMLGYPPENDIDEERWLRALHPEDRDRVLAEEERTDATGEPFGVEYRVIAADGRVVWVRDQAVLVRSEDGRSLYWQGVQFDVTGQKRVEEALRESEERYRVVAETASDAIVMIDEESKILFINSAAEEIFGHAREEMRGRELTMLMPERMREGHRTSLARYLATGRRRLDWDALQLPGLHKSGREIPLEVSFGEFVKDGRRFFTGFIRDITERRMAEEDLRVRDRAIASSSNGIVITDATRPDNPITYVNPAFEEMTGYSAEEVIGRNCRFLQGEDREQSAVGELREAIREGRDLTVVLRNYKKDGTPFWNELTVSPVHDEEGRLTNFVGVLDDVTERRRAEEDLRLSEERFRLLAQMAAEGIVLTENGKIIEANSSFARMFGYGLDEVIGMSGVELVPDTDRKAVTQRITSGDTEAYEGRGLKKGGEAFPIEVRPRNIPYYGRQVRVASVTDLTGRRKAEEALRRSEERFRAIFEQAAVGMAQVSLDGRWLRVNGKLSEIVGYGREELLGLTFQDITHPEDLDADLDHLRRLLDGEIETYSMEKRYIRKNGSIVWIELTVSLVERASGDPGYFIAIIEDITERKRAEEEQRFLADVGAVLTSSLDYRATLTRVARLAVPHLADWCAVDVLDEDGSSLQRLAVAHKDPEKVALAYELQERYPPDPTARYGSPQVLRTGQAELVPEIPDSLLEEAAVDGEHLEILRELGLRSYMVVPLIARGQSLGAITLVTAESERRYGEADLKLVEELARRAALAGDNARLFRSVRQSEELYRTVIEQAAENIFLVDVETKLVIEANAALHESLGYSEEEMKRLTLYDIVAHDRESVDRNIQEIIEHKRRSLSERQYRRKDGSLVDVEVNISMISYRGGDAMCIVAHDVTERKQAEERIREARDAERSRIAQDIHDDTLQTLIYSLQEIQILQISSGEEDLREDQEAVLEDVADALRRSVEGLRSSIFELRLRDTMNQSFVMSLRSLVELTRRMSRKRFQLRLEVDDSFPQEPSRWAGGELVRVLQEALNNARRHSACRNISVRLWREGDMAFAEVADDGKGFDPGSSEGGVGMYAMRRRALTLGGELTIESEPGSGTRIRFELPIARLLEQ